MNIQKQRNKIIFILLLILFALVVYIYYQNHPRAKVFLISKKIIKEISDLFISTRVKIERKTEEMKKQYYYKKVIYPQKQKAKLFYNSGTLALFSGDFEKAISYLSESLKLDSGFLDTYLNLAFAYKQIGDISSAIRVYKSGLFLYSGNAAILKGLAGIYLSQKKRKEAEKYFKKLLEKERNETLVLNYGVVLYNLGKLKKAEELYQNYIKNSGDSYEVLKNLAEIQFKLLEYDKALENYLKVVKLGKGDDEIFYKVGRIYFRNGDYLEANKYLEKIKNKNLEILKLLALNYFNTKDYQRAKKYFYLYLKQDQKNSEIWNYMGECYYQLGEYLQATMSFKKAYKYNKNPSEKDSIQQNILKAEAKLKKSQ